ncbi:protein kinase, partial [candidate division CSSED10-310 bacterium]
MPDEKMKKVKLSLKDLTGCVVNERYTLMEKLGAGGFGSVYRAQDKVLERHVAVKFFDPSGDYSTDDSSDTSKAGSFRERFMREAKILAQIQHPSIVTIFDFGSYEGTPYFVMECLERSLSQVIKEAGIIQGKGSSQKLSLAEVQRIFLRIAEALQYLHTLPNQILHRDLKPSNVMFTHDGFVKLVDFGLARQMESGMTVTQSSVGFGTWIYMSPEQRTDARSVDQRADIYSFGRMLYVTVTGKAPNPFDDIEAPSRYNAELSPAWDTLIQKAGAHGKENRYPDTVALVTAFRTLLPQLSEESSINSAAIPGVIARSESSEYAVDTDESFTAMQTGLGMAELQAEADTATGRTIRRFLPGKKILLISGFLIMSIFLVIGLLSNIQTPLIIDQEVLEEGHHVVLVAKDDILPGTKFSEELLDEKRVPAEEMKPGVLTARDRFLIIGQTAANTLQPGQQLVETDLSYDQAMSFYRYETPRKMDLSHVEEIIKKYNIKISEHADVA